MGDPSDRRIAERNIIKLTKEKGLSADSPFGFTRICFRNCALGNRHPHLQRHRCVCFFCGKDDHMVGNGCADLCDGGAQCGFGAFPSSRIESESFQLFKTLFFRRQRDPSLPRGRSLVAYAEYLEQFEECRQSHLALRFSRIRRGIRRDGRRACKMRDASGSDWKIPLCAEVFRSNRCHDGGFSRGAAMPHPQYSILDGLCRCRYGLCWTFLCQDDTFRHHLSEELRK